jgi:N-acetylglucosaminyl-diphospho-decaprenol L-rhamnosyltransferase
MNARLPPPGTAPAPATVAAVVVTHNSAATLRACLDAALAQPELGELWVVDNGSTDDWRAALPDDPRLHCIGNPDNPGFARACNQGAAASRADWLLFLNPDCELPPAALRDLLAAWATRPTLGLLGAQLVNPDGSPQAAARRRTPTPQLVLRGARPELPAGAAGTAAVEPVEAISGALMLLPRAQFAALGGFDDGYRLHCEDLDLCRRVLLAGREVGLATRVAVLHHKGTSSQRRPVWVEWQKHRGMWRYFGKFDRAATPWWISTLLAAGLLLRFPWAAGRGEGGGWEGEMTQGSPPDSRLARVPPAPGRACRQQAGSYTHRLVAEASLR